MRASISPASRRRTASGLIRMRVRSTARSASHARRAATASCAECRRRPGVGGLDRRLAIGANLPDRLEGSAAAHARLLELRRAHGANEIGLVDLGVTDGAAMV